MHQIGLAPRTQHIYEYAFAQCVFNLKYTSSLDMKEMTSDGLLCVNVSERERLCACFVCVYVASSVPQSPCSQQRRKVPLVATEYCRSVLPRHMFWNMQHEMTYIIYVYTRNIEKRRNGKGFMMGCSLWNEKTYYSYTKEVCLMH